MQKKILKFTFVLFAIFSHSHYLFSLTHQPQLAIFDTTGREEIAYYPFINSTKASGFNVTYVPVDALMDQKNLHQSYSKNYDGIFFILGNEFLRGFNTKSPLTYKIINFLQLYSKQKDKLIGLVFPPLKEHKEFVNVAKKFFPLWYTVDKTFKKHINTYRQAILSPSQTKNTYNDFLFVTNRFLATPLESRVSYHTTLRMPRRGKTFSNRTIKTIISRNKTLNALPSIIQKPASPSLLKTLPYGIHWFNPTNKNHLFVTTKTTLAFSGLEESFLFCPTNFSLRNKINNNISQMMHELYALVTKTKKQPTTPKTIAIGKKLQKPADNYAKKTAWMEIQLFENKTFDKKPSKKQRRRTRLKLNKRRNRLVKYILKAGLDSLWISMTPNVYYSPIAKHKNKEKLFLGSVSRFTKKLKFWAKKLKKPLPKIFVGFEIADNLYNKNLPKRFAHDLYGNKYADIPAPLNQQFWTNEITTPLRTFAQKWKTISHGIPLSGVVLDLEMYCRRTGDIFLTTMGFEHPTFKKFLQKHPVKTPPLSPHQKTVFLMNEQLGRKYFTFLEKQAQKIGRDLRRACNKIIPNGTIACYAQSLFSHWFYKGLWKGLSTKEHPIHLYTFNAEFNAYKNWLADNGIHAYHSGVLLFSKFKRKKDFRWIDYTFKHHHGVWFNRFSRLVEDYNIKSWTHVEQTPLKGKSRQALLHYISKAK